MLTWSTSNLIKEQSPHVTRKWLFYKSEFSVQYYDFVLFVMRIDKFIENYIHIKKKWNKGMKRKMEPSASNNRGSQGFRAITF